MIKRRTFGTDFEKGLNIPGRDSCVVQDVENNRWLLYSTIGVAEVHVSESNDLINWKPIGMCAKFPRLDGSKDFGLTVAGFQGKNLNPAESLTVMKHPLTHQWLMLANWQYIVSDNPESFKEAHAKEYDRQFRGKPVDLGFAGEVVQHQGKWYRSGVFGKRDYWKLGFTDIDWLKQGAFAVIKPSTITNG